MYEKAKPKTELKPTETNDLLDFYVRSCYAAIDLMAAKNRWLITNEKEFNTIYSDYALAPVQDSFFITSDRYIDSAEAIYPWSGTPYSKLFSAIKQNDGSYVVTKLNESFNLPMSHSGTASFSRDYQTVYFTVTPGKDSYVNKKGKSTVVDNQVFRNTVFSVTLTDSGWGQPKPFHYNNPTVYNVQHPALSITGDSLVVVMDVTGSLGKMDLYLCTKDSSGEWTEPVNMGEQINSSDDEVFPVFDHLGRLVFSSDRLSGLGGLDLYGSEPNFKNGEWGWSKSNNLGYPFNSAGDDFSLQWAKDTKKVYLSSNRAGGLGGDDIYSLKLKPELYMQLSFNFPADTLFKLNNAYVEVEDIATKKIEKYPIKKLNDTILIKAGDPRTYFIRNIINQKMTFPVQQMVELKDEEPDTIFREHFKIPTVQLRGRIKDKKNGNLISFVDVELLDNETKKIRKVQTDTTGGFTMLVMPGDIFTASFKKRGYSGADRIDVVVPGKIMNDTIVQLAGGLTRTPAKIVKGEKFVFRNIYFEYNKADLSDSSESDILRIVSFLKEQPEVSVEISAHTDSRGKDAYNLSLSQKRARSVINSLIKHGISPKRLTSKGYGEKQIMNKCKNNVKCSEAEHAVNRRIEMKIMKILASSQ